MQMVSQDRADATNQRVAQGVVTLVNAVALIEGCTRQNALAMVVGATTSLMMGLDFRAQGAAMFRAAADVIEGGGDDEASVKEMERASMAWILAHFPSAGECN